MNVSQRVPEYKIIFVGDTAVGKTSIIMRIQHDMFLPDHQSTVGASFVTKIVETSYGEIKVNIWDTAGQEKYRSLVPMYTRSAAAALIVFDLSDKKSFEEVKIWVNDVKQEMPDDCVIFVVGNKSDLPIDIKRDEAFDWSQKENVQMMFVSALNGNGIDDLFNSVVNTISAIKAKPQTEVINPAQPTNANNNCSC